VDGGGVDDGAVVWAKDRCTTVDVWMPESKNMEMAPNTNDTNTGTYLRINPPSGKAANCTVWKYHKGRPPLLDKRKRPGVIIRPNQTSSSVTDQT